MYLHVQLFLFQFEFEKTFGFVNEATAAVYEQRKEAFLQRNMSMDRHHTFKEVSPIFTE